MRSKIALLVLVGVSTAGCGWSGSANQVAAERDPANATLPANVLAPANVAAPANSANAAAPVANAGRILYLADGGLTSGQPGLHANEVIAFGQPRAQVVAAVSAIRGRPTETSRSTDCGAGPMDFTRFGSLALNFQDDRFVGWTLDGPGEPPLRTEMEIGVGSTRADITDTDQGSATVGTSTLGIEFEFEGLGGFLSSNRPDARITSLYGGITCFHR